MKRRHALALLLPLALAASCALPSTTPRRYALVVGVSRYHDQVAPGTYPNLRYGDDDALDIGQMLVDAGFDEVIVRGRDENGVLVGTAPLAEPFKQTILDDVAHFQGVVGPADLFLLYYSGHGAQVRANNPSWETPWWGHEWIFPKDAVVEIGSSWDFDVSKAIRDDELAMILNQIPTPRKVVILDSCNSGGFISRGLEVDATPASLYADPPPNLVEIITTAVRNYAGFATAGGSGLRPGEALVLSASGAAESSFESGGNGVLTRYLLQTPQRGDLDGDGFVTTLEMFAYAKAGIEQGWNPYVSSAAWVYLPHLSGGPVDYVLFRSP